MENSWLHFGTKFGTKSWGQSKKIPKSVPDCPKMEPRFWYKYGTFSDFRFIRALPFNEDSTYVSRYSHIIMSGRGKGGKVKNKSKSRSSRAGLQFPVGRIHRLPRKRNYAERTTTEDRVGSLYLFAIFLWLKNSLSNIPITVRYLN